MEDIAIVGIGLRFPGNATNPEELWNVLQNGESQWQEFPKDRLNIDGYFHPGGDRQGSISFRGAHFLKGDFSSFDAPFFSVPAEDAKAIDPQQRILLEASYEALENAGIKKEDISGSDAAVYVGSFVKDYEQVCLRDPDWQPQYAATGNGIAIMANRISYFFNLHGPSMTLDTGCSGSLVSVHLAAQSLRARETSLAIAAGAGMILTPNTIMPMTALNFLSPDGKCFTFDARANGYGRGEGIGVVVMKRLSDAIRDNDTIRAVIRGTRVNQDGHTTGITLPSKEAQVANISALYESVGLDFGQTGYVECHGTGTQAGDWRELKAISESLGSARSVDNPIVVGSLKPNIGHLEGAAGVAGLIKGVLTLEKGKIPPNINFKNGNPDIDFEQWKVKVPRRLLDWPLAGLRRVSVNCFGFGGTNAHVILDEAPAYLRARGLRAHHNSAEIKFHRKKCLDSRREPHVFCYSSHEKAGVRRVMDSHVPSLSSAPNNSGDAVDSGAFLRNYAYTLSCRRSILEWKHFIVADSQTELIKKIQCSDESSFRRATRGKQPTLCFVFCGQGAQYAKMGKELMCFDAFRESLEAASYYMKSALAAPFDLLGETLKDPALSQISNAQISQPATTALQIGLIDLFASLDIKPSYVIGHSSGEVAAAYAAGALSREQAWDVAYYRGLASSRVKHKLPNLEGAMLVIGLSLNEVVTYLRLMRLDAEVACVNSPRSITISGTAQSIQQISQELSDKKVFCRMLPVKVAYHSSHMHSVGDEYGRMLEHITPSDSTRAAMFSSVTGNVIRGTALNSDYWVENMVSRVQYVDAVKAMMSLPLDEQPDMILELGPRAALKSPTADILSDTGLASLPTYQSVLDPRNASQHGITPLLQTLGDLWVQGFPVNMDLVVSRGCDGMKPKCLASLPPYPWNHSRSYWHESHLGRANRFREFARQDLIGAPTADAISFEPRWRGFLRISENPWLQDHQVQKTIVYPAAGMVAMALQGASQLTKEKSGLLGYEINQMHIQKAMIIPSTAHGLEMAMNFKTLQDSTNSIQQKSAFEFSIYSKPLDAPWEQHATGVIYIRYKRGDWESMFCHHSARFEALKGVCDEEVVPRQLYELLDIVGMNYGSSFQNITRIAKGDNSCISAVRVPDTKSKMPAKFEYDHIIHPATLDSMFQTLFAIENEPMVPTYIDSLFVHAGITREIGTEFTGYAVAKRTGILNANADMAMTQADWKYPSVVIKGLHFTGFSTSSSGAGGFIPNHRGLCTEIAWDEDFEFSTTKNLQDIVRLLAHKYPAVSLLQVGGSSSLAQSILTILDPDSTQTPRLSRYTIAGGSDEGTFKEVLSFVEGTHLEPFLEQRPVDGSEPLPEYHLILVCEQDTHIAQNLKKHVKVGGILLSTASNVSQDPITHTYDAGQQELLLECVAQPRLHANDVSTALEIIVLVPDLSCIGTVVLTTNIMRVFRKQYQDMPVSYMRADEVLGNLSLIKRSIVISLLELPDGDAARHSVFHWSEDEFEIFHALQKCAKGIIWLAQGAHMKPMNPKLSPIIALARTLISEDPQKAIVTLDLGLHTKLCDFKLAQTIHAVFNTSFMIQPGSHLREMEYAEEHGKLFIPRLIPISSLNRLVEDGAFHETKSMALHGYDGRLKLIIDKAGLSLGDLIFSPMSNSAPASKEVEVRFSSATVTPTDLEIILGKSTESDIGLDVNGIVARIGSEVEGLKEGESVAAITANGAFQNTINIDSRFVKTWTSGLPMSHCLTAYHAISSIGRTSSTKSVLIHAGASSFGLAAIRLAQHLGAEVFATVMGQEAEKQRNLLNSCNLKSDHILEADTDSFASIVEAQTGGKGVDLVFNCTQEHIEANLGCVRKSGIVYQVAIKASSAPIFRMNSSVSIIQVDLLQLLRDDPDYVAALLDEMIPLCDVFQTTLFEASELVQTVELPHFEDAFARVEQRPYLGTVSIVGGPETGAMVRVTAPTRTKSLDDCLSSDGTYLLAGGLGGLGRSICELLISDGVKHLAFLSRSGISSPASAAFIKGLEARGVTARVFQVDICDHTALKKIVLNRVVEEMPPIKGVFQCAAVIKDAVFDNMRFSDWETAIRPKTVGTENLVETITSTGQDPFFIFLASSSGVIGNRGQANYAAGNGYMDALARNLRLWGQHAVSIDLGPVLGAGMLAEDEEILDMLRASGFYGIRHQDFLTMVKHAITMEISPSVPMPPQVIMGIGTGGLIQQNQPADPYWSRTALFSYLNLVDMPPPDLSVTHGPVHVDMKSMLASCADAASAAAIITTGLVHMLAKAMNMLPEEVDAGKPPSAYGVDSLVAVSVRNWVFSNCGVDVSVFEVLSNSTIAELAAAIAAKGGFGVGDA